MGVEHVGSAPWYLLSAPVDIAVFEARMGRIYSVVWGIYPIDSKIYKITYYGPAVKSALIKFQQYYRAENDFR